MAPVTIIAGAVVAVGTGGWEGVCYLKDDRISDYDQVLSVLRKAADQVRSINFMVVNPDSPEHQARLVVGNSSGEFESYDVEDIYIVNEEVYHRDWFLNTNLGPVPFD